MTRKLPSLIIVGAILLVGIYHQNLYAQMQSSNYQISQDSINIGGGSSSSGNYQLEDTVGEVGTGKLSSTNYQLLAGYQQLEESILELSSPSDVTMPPLSGVIENSSQDTVTWSVSTSNSAGYELYIKSSTDPAMQGFNYNINDYVPSSSDPDYDFQIPSNSAEFGYSPSGNSITSEFKDNGSQCNAIPALLDTLEKCWAGFSTVNKLISTRSSAIENEDTVVYIRAANGSNNIIKADTYQAVLTVTLLSL